MPPSLSKVRILALVAACLFPVIGLSGQTPEPAADGKTGSAKPIFEEWVVLILDGKPCGFGSTITTPIETPDGPHFVTEHEDQFVVKRLSTPMTITETYTVTEDADGGVLNFKQVTSGVGSHIESSGVREGDVLVVTGRGQTQRYHIPRLDALGPEKIRQLSYAVPLKAGQTFSFKTFASDYPQAIVVESGTVEGQETRNVRGTERTLWKMTSGTSTMPGLLSTTWVDDHGNNVENLTVIPGIGNLHESVTTRAECMKRPEGADVFAQNLIRPQQELFSPADQEEAVYRLTLVDLSKSLELWDEGEQRILSTGPGTCDLSVTARHFTAADANWELPHADTVALHPYLQPSTYLEVNSPIIQSLAQKAVGGQTNPVLAAHAIEDFVRGYITKKDFNVGFGSAEETAKSREGDCTEHAVLCAALGRAVGLPTRCVVGFGYIEPGDDFYLAHGKKNGKPDTGAFAFHMWAEAWIGPDRWVPMDAALDGFDVGHIAITKTALEEINPLAELNSPILQLMSNLKIEVLKTVSKGPPVPEAMPPSTSPSAPQEAQPAPSRPVPPRAQPPID